MKILEAPDIHCPDKRTKPEWHEKAIASLTTLAETVERERPALVTIPGDLYHGGIQNSEAAGFPAFLRLIRRILDVCPIAAVSGTASHDPFGAYKALATLKAKHPFILLDPNDMSPPVAWICEDGKVEVEIWSKDSPVSDGHTAKLMIVGLPEPSREWLLAEAKEGEDATAALKDLLRAILLGFGALRAQYPDIPCVFLYHGAVAGATMQNGQTVGASEIVIGREDLQLIASDITAWYGGNAYPKEWGELGQVGFNMVDLQPGDTYGSLGHIHLAQEVVKGREISITRINYPHPRREKFVVDYPEPVGEQLVQGIEAWICINASKQEAAEIDTEALLEAYVEQGALPGSRVTVKSRPDDKVRAPEIAEKKLLREKAILYAEANGLPAPSESVLLKADQLEHEAEERGETQRTSIVIHSLKLHGAKGIYKGRKLLRRLLNLPALPLDDIEIDFDNYVPGTIGLIGPTGGGKTTLLTFLAPYTDMPGRRGPLRNHFRLRDSRWELTFSDEYSGNAYRVLVEIDGLNKDGKANCHLYVNGAPINDGAKLSIDDFDSAVLKLFGSSELFVRCSYVAQKNGKDNPDLADATKGDRTAIVRELSGLDYLQGESENAKAKGDVIGKELEDEGKLVNLLESQLTALPGIRADVETKGTSHVAAVGQVAEAVSRATEAASEAEALAEKVRAQKSIEEKIASLTDQAAQKQQAINFAEQLITDYGKAVELQPRAQKAVDTWTQLKEQEGKENARLAEISKERERLAAEYGRVQKAHSDACRELEGQQSKLRTKSAIVAGDRKVLQAQIEHLARDLKDPLKENCLTCGQVLPVATLAKLKAERVKSEDRLVDLSHQQEDMGQQISEIGKELAAIVLPPAPSPPILPRLDETGLSRILIEMGKINIDGARKVLAAAQEAATRIEETHKAADQAKAAADLIEYDLEAAKGALDPRIQPAHKAAQDQLAVANFQRDQAQRAVSTLEAQIKAMQDRIVELEKQALDLEERKAKTATKKAELGEWRFLQEACGPKGIQSLELGAIGPGIAATANALLSNVFGSRFTIEFRTERMVGRGADAHQGHDFSIWIIDNDDNASEQEFFTLSGGESVPVRLAIYEAFAKVREQKFSPMILDEADGQLDPSLRAGYVEMIDRAREKSGRRNTMLISHSVEVQEMVAQKIDLVKLAQQSQQETAA